MLSLRKHISIYFLLLVLINSLSSALVIGSFYANQDYFAENFCVNKSKPTICAGSCYLTKTLQAMETEQNEPVALKIPQLSFEFISDVISEFDFTIHTNPVNHTTLFYTLIYQSRMGDCDTPPPQG